MAITDPIADMLTRIRNANAIRREKADVPFSTMKESILKIIKEEGFIKDYLVFGEGKLKTLRVVLKYGPSREYVINQITRRSTPGRRVYVGVEGIEPVLDGMGISVFSTSKGIMSDRQCRRDKIGGELLLTII